MRKITRKSISVLLVVALLLAGIQSVRIADMAGSGVVAAEMTADMSVMDHDCSDCDSQDCCADMNCQMTSHCLAYPAMLAGSDLSVFDGPADPALRLASPSLPSRLIPTIYRPPWA